MHAITTSRGWAAAGTTAVVLALVPGVASADRPPGGGTQTGGSIKGNTLESKVSFNPAPTAGKSQSGDFHAANDWTPPACWYEPMSAADFKAASESSYNSVVDDPSQPSYAKSAMAELKKMYTETKYKDYNLDQADKGAFWVGVQNPLREKELASFSCNNLPEWVPNGTPPVPQRHYARDPRPGRVQRARHPRHRCDPGTHGEQQGQPGHLDLERGTLLQAGQCDGQPVGRRHDHLRHHHSEPVSLHVKPGTSEATVQPGSGECAINADGSIGAAYVPGSDGKNPPCGVTYLRSSGTGSYTLEASITWEVSWSSPTAPGARLPSGTFTTTENVTVQEIQAVNR